MMLNIKYKSCIKGMATLLLAAAVFSCNTKTKDSDKTDQKIFNIEKWHVKISIDTNYILTQKKSFCLVTDTIASKSAFISILENRDGKETFINSVTASAFQIYSTGCHGEYSTGDSIVKWENHKNIKGTEIHHLFIRYSTYTSNDTSDMPGYTPPSEIIWKISDQITEGPAYYVEIPEKYGAELNMSRAFSFYGDSTIVNDILDDFEFQ
jgi:hypothetical protein